jgi:hypothetical protein
LGVIKTVQVCVNGVTPAVRASTTVELISKAAACAVISGMMFTINGYKRIPAMGIK